MHLEIYYIAVTHTVAIWKLIIHKHPLSMIIRKFTHFKSKSLIPETNTKARSWQVAVMMNLFAADCQKSKSALWYMMMSLGGTATDLTSVSRNQVEIKVDGVDITFKNNV